MRYLREMIRLTFNQKRVVMAAAVALLILGAANRWYGWNLLGMPPKRFTALSLLIAGVIIYILMPGMMVEMEKRRAAEKAADIEAGRTRDESRAAQNTEQIRRDIGM